LKAGVQAAAPLFIHSFHFYHEERAGQDGYNILAVYQNTSCPGQPGAPFVREAPRLACFSFPASGKNARQCAQNPSWLPQDFLRIL